MDYYIITGASKGIGEALARGLMHQGNTLFAISRTRNHALAELAAASQVPFHAVDADLSNSSMAEVAINSVFELIDLKAGDSIALINNAGMLEPVAPLKSTDFTLAEKHFHLNLLAPFILSSVFIERTSSFHNKKVILNISSGASFIPYSGWGAYCSSKAGLDMFTKVAGLEQKVEDYPVTIYALAPGIIETSMQQLIRQTDESLFPERNSFVKLHEEGELSKPEDVASIIIRTLFSGRIETGTVLTIDHLKEMTD